jgi:hypothetical protein
MKLSPAFAEIDMDNEMVIGLLCVSVIALACLMMGGAL